MKYITTDYESDFQLESGTRYFMDFDVSGTPYEVREHIPGDRIAVLLKKDLRDRGHEILNVRTTHPTPNIVRVYFTPENPPPLWLLVILTIAIVGALTAAAYQISGSIHCLFVGLAEALTTAAKVPFKIIESAIENPIAVIAIMFAVGIFILGRKF